MMILSLRAFRRAEMIRCWVVCCVAALLQCCCFAVLFLALAVLLSSLAVLPSCCLVGLVGFPVIGCCLVVSLSPFLPFSPSSLSPFRFPILTKNRPKIDPESTENPPRMETKSKKRRSTAQNGTRWVPRVVSLNVPRHFWTILGSPLAPQNRPKIDFWRKSWPQRWRFHSFFSIFCLCWLFASIWVDFWRPRPSKSDDPNRDEPLFQFPEKLQKWPPNRPKIGENRWKIDAGRPENHQNCQKKVLFLRGWFFDDFLGGKKAFPRGHATPRVTGK